MSKYNSRKIQCEDGVFDSKKEYRRWLVLKDMEKSGDITHLRRQVKYELIPAQYEYKPKKKCIERACSYIADFVYYKNDVPVIEDVKGYRKGTAYSIFTIKRKLMLYRYGIRIKEV